MLRQPKPAMSADRFQWQNYRQFIFADIINGRRLLGAVRLQLYFHGFDIVGQVADLELMSFCKSKNGH